MSELPIESLFDLFRTRGDLKALAKVFDLAAPELLPLALHLTGRRHDAEDLVQQTFLAALEKAPEYDAARPLRPWLVGILVREARRVRRSQARVIEPERLRVPSSTGPEESAIEGELRAAVANALGDMPQKYGQALSLHLFEGLSPGELAERLGIDADLARTHLARGLERLRRSLPPSVAIGWNVAELGAAVALIRTRVFERARLVPAAAAASGVLQVALGLAASLCAVAALTAGGLSLARESNSEAMPVVISGPEPEASGDAATEPALVLEPSSGTTREELQAPAHRSVSASTRVQGRIALPDGSPARGVTVSLEGWDASPDLVERYGTPKEWKNPAPARTDDQGNFEFRLDPPRAFQWVARAKLESFVDVGWHWSEWVSGQDRDLGVARFEPGCVLAGSLHRADGKPIGEGWYISVTPEVQAEGPDSLYNMGNAAVDPVTGRFEVRGLRAGTASVSADCAMLLHGCETQALLLPGTPTSIELSYAGPDPSHIVLVGFSNEWNLWGATDGLVAELVGRDGERLKPKALGSGPVTKLSFEDVPDSDWRLEVHSPRFAPIVQEGVHPGQRVRIQLRGDAAIALSVLDADGRPVEHYDLHVRLAEGQSLRGRRMALAAESSPAGRKFEQVPAGMPVELEVTAPGLGSARAQLAALAAGETRSQVITFARTRTLRLRTLASDGKSQLANLEVELTRGDLAGHPFGPGAMVSSNGNRIPPRDFEGKSAADGSTVFSGLNDGPWTARVNWSPWLISDVGFRVGADAPEKLDIAEPAHGYLRGRVLLSPSESLRDQQFDLDCASAPRAFRMKTLVVPSDSIAEDGSFRWGPLPVGEWRIHLLRNASLGGDNFTQFLELARVSIEAGKDLETTLDLRSQCAAHVKLSIALGGKPLPRAYAQALPVDDFVFGAGEFGEADAQGVALLTLAPLARKRIGIRGPDWVWALPEELTPGLCETLERSVDVPLVKGELRLVDPQTSAPLRHVDVGWEMVLRGKPRDAGAPGPIQLQSNARGTTGANGELELHLPPGELRVWRRGPDDLHWDPQLEEAKAGMLWTEKGPAAGTLAVPLRK